MQYIGSDPYGQERLSELWKNPHLNSGLAPSDLMEILEALASIGSGTFDEPSKNPLMYGFTVIGENYVHLP